MRFVHAADIHLDSPLRGLSNYAGAPVDEIRGATRRAFKNLISLVIDPEEGIDFLLISGDLYDGDWQDYNTGLFFIKQMSILADTNVPVYIVKGNHDAQSQITRYLSLPQNVNVFSVDKSETVVLNDLGVAIHGQSFASRVTADLAGGYPDAIQGLFNIGLLHTSATGYSGHDVYAPCSVASLATKGYDYWSLGHIQKRQVLCSPDVPDGLTPWIVFPGNIQGRHAGELGPKGCTMVTVSDGHIDSVEHRDLDVARWYVCTVDATEAVTADDVIDRVQQAVDDKRLEAPEQLLAIRIQIRGRCSANSVLRSNAEHWVNEIRARALSDQVWIEQVKMLTEDECNDSCADDWTGLVDSVANIAKSEKVQEVLLSGLETLKSRLPVEFRTGEDPLDLSNPGIVANALPDVQQILLSRLLGKED